MAHDRLFNPRDKRVTVLGLGRFGGGIGVTRWLCQQGARVTVTDQAPAETLSDSIRQLADYDIRWHLGSHDESDFRDTDLLVVSPAVPNASPWLRIARDRNIPITAEINLFVERCPAAVVGVTGTVGKSTVTSMIGRVLEHGLPDRRTWVGGNIGRSLLEVVDEIRPDDLVVLELSSFQLDRLAPLRWSPRIAVFTRISPNHLDWHGSYHAYVAAKLNLMRFQDPARDTIVCPDTQQMRDQFEQMFGDLAGIYRYGVDGNTPTAVIQEQSSVDFDSRWLRWEDLHLRVPGQHNLENAAAALCVAEILGADREAARAALAGFEALPHRLQHVATRHGVRYFDDSKSSTPDATRTALQAFEAPVLLILGGYDKKVELAPLANDVAGRCKFVACIGQTGPRLEQMISTAGGEAEGYESLPAAVAACAERAAEGDVVLLSPGCASWGMFSDFQERGRVFREAVELLPDV